MLTAGTVLFPIWESGADFAIQELLKYLWNQLTCCILVCRKQERDYKFQHCETLLLQIAQRSMGAATRNHWVPFPDSFGQGPGREMPGPEPGSGGAICPPYTLKDIELGDYVHVPAPR